MKVPSFLLYLFIQGQQFYLTFNAQVYSQQCNQQHINSCILLNTSMTILQTLTTIVFWCARSNLIFKSSVKQNAKHICNKVTLLFGKQYNANTNNLPKSILECQKQYYFLKQIVKNHRLQSLEATQHNQDLYLQQSKSTPQVFQNFISNHLLQFQIYHTFISLMAINALKKHDIRIMYQLISYGNQIYAFYSIQISQYCNMQQYEIC
eukprot:TRINITY_DN3482_c0_g4_i1.p2 TRINITY_DN3482_c0_g4~~TRINITY_DN3482_c0_g4_i1.p2  ORF type:complete len:207 (-),score=-20.23 TRINITY_DN3482_c0_g4_i1:178-798(-)